MIGLSISFNNNEAYYLPFGHKEGQNLSLPRSLDALKPILESLSIIKIGHNIKYDVEVMKKYNIEVSSPYFDTMVAAYLVDPTVGRYNLKRVGAQYLGRHEMINFDELESEGDFSNVPVETAKDYACSDANVTFELYSVLIDLLKKDWQARSKCPYSRFLLIWKKTVFILTPII